MSSLMVAAPHHPSHPERVCWGCERNCPAADLACGNGSVRTPHPAELFGDDWDAPRSRAPISFRELVYPRLGRDEVDFERAYGP